jgi:VWFA-related protein
MWFPKVSVGAVSVLVFLLLGITLITPAQNPLQVKVDVQLIPVDVVVDDAAGKPITNLVREDFTVFEDGEPREIQSFESAENPYNILLLFDRSSSTEDQWSFLVRAVARFFDQLPSQHRVAMAAFDDKPELLFPWKNASDLRRQPFLIHSNNSGTNVYGALEWATQELRKVKGRKGAIVFTDGVDNRLSKKLVSFDRNGKPTVAPMEMDADFQKVLQGIVQSRTPIYFVAVNTDQNPDPREPPNDFDLKQRIAARLRMKAIADRSNGALYLPEQIGDVGALYERIGKELGYAYSLSFTPRKAARDGSSHHVDVRVRDSSMRVTASREGYSSQ